MSIRKRKNGEKWKIEASESNIKNEVSSEEKGEEVDVSIEEWVRPDDQLLKDMYRWHMEVRIDNRMENNDDKTEQQPIDAVGGGERRREFELEGNSTVNGI